MMVMSWVYRRCLMLVMILVRVPRVLMVPRRGRVRRMLLIGGVVRCSRGGCRREVISGMLVGREMMIVVRMMIRSPMLLLLLIPVMMMMMMMPLLLLLRCVISGAGMKLLLVMMAARVVHVVVWEVVPVMGMRLSMLRPGRGLSAMVMVLLVRSAESMPPGGRSSSRCRRGSSPVRGSSSRVDRSTRRTLQQGAFGAEQQRRVR
jgi:hypothetical protein